MSPVHPHKPTGKRLALLSLGALGVVYGDIGTSPLYALRESLHPDHGVEVSSTAVLGILSLILWSLVIVITIKYLTFVMRADQQGEGGILVLASLVTPKNGATTRRRTLLILVGLFGTALLYGDGMITPAISVLSAVEGLEVSAPSLEPYVLEITALILIGLFLLQRRGTGSVGRIFGPVMIVWFATIGALGIQQIAIRPEVLRAVNPMYALSFFADHGFKGFLVLGSVFLVVTGGEALYADMGHFGRRPIRLAWFTLVLPGLLLNYFGQGALVIGDPKAIDSPFFLMAPDVLRWPLILLATTATVIASQALISGAFSLAMQSVQLGYLPRLRIEHTSAHERGQVYVPAVNWALMVACILLVFGFRSSTNLAAAYGVAVTATMVITTVLFFVVARDHWNWPRWLVGPLTLVFFTVDLGFLGANLFKIPQGGWFPLVAGAAVFAVMTTWKTGKRIVNERVRGGDVPLEAFIQSIEKSKPMRVPGTAVYMYGRPYTAPPALVTNLRYNRVVHEQILLVAIVVEDTPRVHPRRALKIEHLDQGITQAVLHVGYMQRPDVPRALEADAAELRYHPLDSHYFLSRETIIVTDRPGIAPWREHLYALMARNARNAAAYFGIPPERAVEVGIQVEL
ncbi:MAG: potassium transporter Kup [Actinobacteria bacterium RBG_16_68_21]|nr:MAG: potassium transporter Kup [Actinobacteria bacterium RBG_16_68_21]